MNTKARRRKVKDRRANNLKLGDALLPCNRRQSSRRLNDISVEEVFMGTFIHNQFP
jgi:hypothetical protein